MSDYFGALMNLSGIGERGRAPIAPAPVSQVGGDIVESETVREAVAPERHGAPSRGPESVALPIARDAAPAGAAGNTAGQLPIRADATTDARPAQRAAARPITALAPAAAVAAPAAAEPHHAVVRAAMEWVAGDPQNIVGRHEIAEEQRIVTPPAPAAAATTRISQPATEVSRRRQEFSTRIEETEIVGIDAAPRMQVAHRVPPADLEIEPIRAPAHQNATPAARIIAAPPASGRVAPAMVADEIVEISIGAISVRVDAPVPQAPAAPAPPARIPSERSVVSALSRRALRRF